MILSDVEIERLGLVDPFIPKTPKMGLTGGCGGHSYDVHFGNQWGEMHDTNRAICPTQIDDEMFLWRESDEVIIYPGEFLLATTQEVITLPVNVACQVTDKSTWARLGLSAFNTFGDPGFKGNFTLELVNHSPRPILLRAGQPAVQFVFFDAIEARAPYAGRYQGQAGLVGPRSAGIDGWRAPR